MKLTWNFTGMRTVLSVIVLAKPDRPLASLGRYVLLLRIGREYNKEANCGQGYPVACYGKNNKRVGILVLPLGPTPVREQDCSRA
jgi:hypothetical protein